MNCIFCVGLLAVFVAGIPLAYAQPEPALIPDLNKPLAFSSTLLMQRVPLPYRDMTDPHTFVIVPLSYRVQGIGGSSGIFVVKLSDGSVRVRATLAPYPATLEGHSAYRELIEALKKRDPHARLVYPTLRDPRVSVLAPSAEWFSQEPRLTGSGGVLIRNWDVTLAVKKEYADVFLEDMKRDVGVMGQLSFVVSARSGNQIIDWPVTLAWFLGKSGN